MQTVTRRGLLASGLALGTALATAPLRAQAAPATADVIGRVERLDPALDALIDVGAKIETINSGLTWCEGPTWVGGADGALFYSDVIGNRIHRWNRRDGDKVWIDPSGYARGVADGIVEPGTNGLFSGRGGLLAADSGNRCVSRIDLKTRQRVVLTDKFEGKRFNSPNDMCISPRDGSIYFTDPAYGLKDKVNSPLREMDYTGIFRIAPDNSVTLMGKFDIPNGIGISPDGRTVYHTDIKAGWLAHSIDDRGNFADTRTFIARDAIPGGDGLKIDSRGNMWTSSRDGIWILDPSGKRLGVIRITGICANCTFGADGYLYMTCNHQVARIKVKARKLPTA